MRAAVRERLAGVTPKALGKVESVVTPESADDGTEAAGRPADQVKLVPAPEVEPEAAGAVAGPEPAAETEAAVEPAAEAGTEPVEPAAETAAETAEPVGPRADHPRTVAGKRWPLVVLAVLAALGAAGTGYFFRYWLNDRSTSSQTNEVRATTTNFVTALTKFDPGTIDSDFAKIQSLATGTFANQARQYFGSSIRNQLIAAGSASRGQIRDLFVESLGGGQATVFVVVDQDYVNNSMKSTVSDTLRLELGLTDTSSGWLVSSVNVLQSPTGFTGPTPSASAPGGKSK